MRRDEFTEMRAFLEVAKERSFTKAAARMGVTTSALSHTIKGLEARLGVRLLSRTTRDVAPTAAGERLRAGIEPHFAGIAAEIVALGHLSEELSGQVRIVCTDDAVDTVFRPRLPRFLADHPGIKVELMVDNGYSNIVESQFDGVSDWGSRLPKIWWQSVLAPTCSIASWGRRIISPVDQLLEPRRLSPSMSASTIGSRPQGRSMRGNCGTGSESSASGSKGS